MAYSFAYAHIYFTLLLLVSSSSSSIPPPLATSCVVIEDFSDGHFNFYSNECRGKSPYCLFACIQHRHPLRSPISSSAASAAAASSCFLVRFFDSGHSEVDRFNCSDLAYCSLSCLGPGVPDFAAAADRSTIDLSVDGPLR